MAGNIVPRANEAGTLGRADKRFGEVHARDVIGENYANIKGQWRPGEVVGAEDVRYPNNSPAYNFLLRCVKGGVTGAVEPIWPDAGKEMADGTAIWRVEQVSKRVLTANTTVYIRQDGNDSNDGLANTPERALKTVEGVYKWLKSTNANHNGVTFSFGAGIYATFDTMYNNQLILSDTFITITSSDKINRATICGFSILNATWIRFVDIDILCGHPDYPLSDQGLNIQANAYVDIVGTVNISGSAIYGLQITSFGTLFMHSNAVINFNNLTANVIINLAAGTLVLRNNARITGTATGRRYSLSEQAHMRLWTNINVANLIPGTINGTVSDNSTFWGLTNPNSGGQTVKSWSGETTFAPSTTVSIAHGIANLDPAKCIATVSLVCTKAYQGYAVGETVTQLVSADHEYTVIPIVPKITQTDISVVLGVENVYAVKKDGVMMYPSSTNFSMRFNIVYWE